MAHEALKEAVCKANLDLVRAGLVILTWGNVSGADREAGVMAIKPEDVPGVLVAGHGPFAWGRDVPNAVENAIALEATARMALDTLRINPDARSIDDFLLDKHHGRKHGSGAYYGQRRS